MSAVVIRDQKTGEEVHRMDTSSMSDSQKERAFMGVMRQADLDRYYVEEVD